jgi:AhpD family alkylhydroperoxidase
MGQMRMKLWTVVPEAYKAVSALEAYARSHVDPTLYELVKLRASIVNGCAFCVDMHTTDLLQGGEDVRRVVAVAAWRESTFFSDGERVALDLTDVVTRLGEHGVPDDLWKAAESEFGPEGLANLLVAIATINVWNRIAVSTHAEPPPLAS